MKLLGWMHRKLMQNSTDQIKNPTIGAATSFSLSNEHNYLMEPSRLSRSSIAFHNSSSYSESTTKFQDSFEFLSIGTFGVELPNTEPPTPTLPMVITENDLNLINLELEKFLDAEETTDDTSERSSHASIITLCYKPNEGAESGGHIQMAAAACPLQNYLLAASVETEKEVKKERASLGELFKRSNIVLQEDAAVKKCQGAEQHYSRKGTSVAHFMKKVVKKFHSSSNIHDTAPSKKKLSKSIVKMFEKKVYPEEMTEKQYMKMSKGRNKNETKKSKKKKAIKLCFCKGASPVNAAGHWIKTDSDCKSIHNINLNNMHLNSFLCRLGIGAVAACSNIGGRFPHACEFGV